MFYRMIGLMVMMLAATPSLIGEEECIDWECRCQKALAKARLEKKPALLYFTGSDWSGWSMKMKKELLEEAGFVALAKDQFVFVEIDFPQHKTMAADLVKENEKLKKKWQVQEFPRLILLNCEHQEIERFGFSSEKPEKFARELLCLVEKDKYLTETMKKFQTTQLPVDTLRVLYGFAGEFKRSKDEKMLLDYGVACGHTFFLVEKYRLLVEGGKGESKEALNLREKLLESDPQNTAGVAYSLALIDFQKLSNLELTDSKLVIKPLEDYLAKYGATDQENRWRLEMILAQFYLNYKESTNALEHAEVAYDCAPESRREEIQRSLHYIRNKAAQDARYTADNK